MKRLFYFWAIVFMIGFIFDPGFAYELPNNDPQAQYFGIFGLQGSRFDGSDKANPDQVIYFDVPENQASGFIIDVFDPDTGGKLDQKDPGKENWETIFQFAVYGKEDGLLAKKSFSDSVEYDRAYYRFGPYPKEMGSKIKGFYRFKLVVSPIETLILKGDDLNLFRVRVYPEDVKAFSEKISLRLPAHKNEEMYFYPEIPAGESEIIVENYDLDPEGGSVRLYDPLTQKDYQIDNSGSGVWAQTTVHVSPSDQPRCLEYIITKKTQQYGNASIRVKDRKGHALPIYYSQKPHKALPAAAVVSIPIKTKEVKIVLVKKSSNVEQKSPVIAPPMKTTSMQCNKFIFDGTGSYDPNNEKLSFFWDFGDSATSVEPVVTHVFEKGGQYTVTLTVKDSSGLKCDSSSKTQVVNVNIPPVAEFIAPETACVNQEIVFDASSTTDDTPENLTYFWDFADGTTGEGKLITKKFTKGGMYSVNLTVNDNANTARSKVSLNKPILVNTPPIARAGGDIRMCVLLNKDYEVVFDGGKSIDADGDTLSYSWDFGDGESGTGKKVTHVYKTGGSYIAKLTVNDGRSSVCSTSEETISVVLNKQPVAVAGADQSACPGQEVIFDGTGSSDADKDALTYTWDFGDGATSEGEQARHNFEKPGKYRVVLSIDDGRQTLCSSAKSGLNVFVNTPPKAALEKVAAVCVGSNVKFDASRTSGVGIDSYKYTWDFGDGTVIEGGKKAAHEYKKGGKFTVKVIVDDKRNTPCSADSASIEVTVNTPPKAVGRADFACCIDTDSVFDGTASSDADGDSLTYQWEFGDGGTAQSVKAAHRYNKGGVYTVTLKVDDNSQTACSSSQTSFKVRINEQPVPVIKVK
ncbi:MAG: PKD domain-containing protein [Candidatus Omnitrophica bacterium]|nr:PKD domain-containing protein [Candidatus Omnitrophota bacterium]